jgi:hypothetical protein
MTSDQPLRERSEPAAVSLREAVHEQSLARSGEVTEGGDPACWACLVCQGCGAVVSEGHRAGCSRTT